MWKIFLNYFLAINFILFFTIIVPVHSKEIVRAEFTKTPLTKNTENLDHPISQSTIRLYFDDQSVKDIPLNYKELFRSGQRIGLSLIHI